jgi:hypothetical protein
MNQPFGIPPAAAAPARAASATNEQKKQRRKSMTTNKSSHTGISDLDKLNKELERRLGKVDMSGLSSINGFNGINGMNGLASLGAINGMTGHARTTSRAGRGTPTPEVQHQRPNGKKRQSREYVVSGRGSAPPQVPVPPGFQALFGRF